MWSRRRSRLAPPDPVAVSAFLAILHGHASKHRVQWLFIHGFRTRKTDRPAAKRATGRLTLRQASLPVRQMSLAYSRMERSEENQLMRAVLRTAFSPQDAVSIQVSSIWRCVFQ